MWCPCDYRLIDIGGVQHAVDRDTGEVLAIDHLPVIRGSLILPPKKADKFLERREQVQAFLLRRDQMNALGKFIFVTSASTPNLSPEALARLVLLATYTPWGKNCPRITQRREATKADLPGILQVSISTSNRFLREVSPDYLAEGNSGNFTLRGDLFRHGCIPKGMKKSYRKIFIAPYRSLYSHALPSQHKLMGYILSLLGAIHIESNVLCHNPTEADAGLIEPLTAQEFCGAIGYDPRNFSRLRRDYENLRFEHDGRFYKFCVFDKDGIRVNPRVLYSGSNYAPLLNHFR